MEAAPPSYSEATLIDHWDLVAHYIPPKDLCAATLVCRKWHAVFIPQLWGNVAAHFGEEDDEVYVALIRFKRTLSTARLLVRSLTHTLHLPPAQAELYNGLKPEWLRDILDRLPNLQSLVVRGLSFFDHAALQALKGRPQQTEMLTAVGQRYAPRAGVIELPAWTRSTFQAPTSTIPTFGLRLLDASRCPNVTSKGLAQALGRFETLIYIDFSYTTAARDQDVLAVLLKFRGLQVLKLRGIGLRDEDVGVLAQAIKLRVRSLDIRNNRIGGIGLQHLLEHCFLPPHYPRGLPYMASEMLQIYQGTGFESYLRKVFTGSFVSKLTIEDAPDGGLTHLYLAGNHLPVGSVASIVKTSKLHCLDVGSIEGLDMQNRIAHQAANDSDLVASGIEKLSRALHDHAQADTTFLRIDHAVVTRQGTSTDNTLGQGHPPAYVLGSDGDQRPRSFSSLSRDRKSRIAFHLQRLNTLHPAMIPRVDTLVLTNVPTVSPTGQEARHIIEFIKSCAKEAHSAMAQASLDYTLPPSRRGDKSAINDSATRIFALKRVVLEMSDPELGERENNTSSSWPSSGTQSMTEDRDSETLWNAAETDFSFFGDNEDSDMPRIDPRTAQTRQVSNKQTSSVWTSDPRAVHRNDIKGPNTPTYDTIALLSDFRKGRKLAHQRDVDSRAVGHPTEGYWDGIVSVVRPAVHKLGPDEELDYCGNVFDGRGLYR